MKNKFLIFSAVLLILAFTSCASTKYYGPRNYVGFSSEENISTSTQYTLDYNKNEVVPTFEEEFSYDNDGNIIKTKLTEYFDRDSSNPKYIIWENEYIVIGDHVVPSKAYVNGELYCSVDYDVLAVEADGEIIKDVSGAFFYKEVTSFFFGGYRQVWDISLSEYPVPFMDDEKFIREYSSFNPYYGFEYANVLNIGYDNIVIKEYYYSYEELLKGISNSLPYNSQQSRRLRELSNGHNIKFEYTWETIADKACPVSISFISRNNDKENAHMIVDMKYDASGNRTFEEWNVITEKGERITVFKHELSY